MATPASLATAPALPQDTVPTPTVSTVAFATSPIHLVWLALGYLLASRVFISWWQCVSQRTTSENGIINLAALVAIAAGSGYWKTAPPVMARYHRAGIACLMVMSLLTASAMYFHFLRIYWLGFIGMVAGFLWAIGGRASLRHWSPLILFSVALLPGAPAEILDATTSWLKMLTFKVTMSLTSLLIPIQGSGVHFSIRGQTYEIANACCGISMLSAYLFVILLWNVYARVRLSELLKMMGAALVLSVILNGLRLSIAAMLAYHLGKQVALDWHTNLEFVLFPAGLLVLWCIRRRQPTA